MNIEDESLTPFGNISNDQFSGAEQEMADPVNTGEIIMCLACGSSNCGSSAADDCVDFPSLIKTEPGDEDENIHEGDVYVGEREFRFTEQGTVGVENDTLFGSFCEFMGVNLAGVSVVHWKGEEDGENSSYPSPFCEDCRKQLRILIGIQAKLRELERALKDGIGNLKQVVERAEVTFGQSRIYERDPRYLKIREHICNVTLDRNEGGEANPSSPTRRRKRKADNEEEPRSIPIIRRSGRKPKPRLNLEVISKDAISEQIPRKEEDAEPEYPVDFNEDYDFSDADDTLNYEPSSEPAEASRKKRKLKTPSKKVGKPSKSKDIKPKSSPKVNVIKSKRKAKDEDYIPPGGNEASSDDELSTERLNTDHRTGNVSFVGVSFEKLDNGKFRCVECDSSMGRGFIRNHAIRKHTDKFVCGECGQHCASARDLKRHVGWVHRGDVTAMKECPICGKPMQSPTRVRIHMVTHLSAQEKEDAITRGEVLPSWPKIRKHICEECGKAYEVESDLIQHKVREHPSLDHTEEDKLLNKEMCPDCGKLIRKQTMKLHRMRMHSDEEKPCMCSLCEKRFWNERELRNHKLAMHEQDRPHECPLCPKRFVTKSQIKVHMNSCQKIKPFQCEHCPMAFFKKYHLERHFKCYHEEGANPRRNKHLIVLPTTNSNVQI